MHLPKAAIIEFQEIYFSVHGIHLTETEARQKSATLMKLYELSKPFTP